MPVVPGIDSGFTATLTPRFLHTLPACFGLFGRFQLSDSGLQIKSEKKVCPKKKKKKDHHGLSVQTVVPPTLV